MRVQTFQAILLVLLCSSLMISLSSESLSVTRGLSSSGKIRGTLTWLHVEGKYIKNEYGEIVWLRGAAFPDLSFQLEWGGWIEPGWDNFLKLSDGKANVIRCTMHGHPWTVQPPYPYPDHPELYDRAVDQLVDWAERNNVYVILEFHGFAEAQYHEEIGRDPTPWINWILHFVERYKNRPAVAGFEIFNEPWHVYWGGNDAELGMQRFIDGVTRCCEAINAVNPKLLILVPSSPFAFVMQYWCENPLPYNVVYTWDQYYRGWDDYYKQPYRDGNWDLAYQRAYKMLYEWGPGKAAVQYNLPVFGTEFGWVPATPDLDPAWEVSANHWFSIINGFGSHWYYWYFPPSASMGTVTYPDVNTLGPVGQIWKKYLGPSHCLKVESTIVTGGQTQNVSGALVEFNGVPFKSTPVSIYAGETEHTVSVPETITVNGTDYRFVRWEDGSTNPTRTIKLTTDMTVTSIYTRE